MKGVGVWARGSWREVGLRVKLKKLRWRWVM